MVQRGAVEKPQGTGRIFSSLGRAVVSILGFLMLAAPAWSQEPPASPLPDQVEIRRSVEQYFQEKVLAVLDPVVGLGRSSVSVTADIDFDRIERTEERFHPQDSVVRAENRSQEILTPSESESGKAEGITANLPAEVLKEPEKKPLVLNEKTSRSYEISKTVAHVIREPGTIRKLSVCAVVDGTYVSGEDEGAGPRRYVPRTEREIETYRKIITASIGELATAQVEVVNAPFDATALEQRASAPEVAARAQRYYELHGTAIRWAGIVAIAFVCFLSFRYVFRALSMRRGPGEPVATGPEDIGPASSRVSVESRVVELADEISAMVRQNPDDMVSLLRRWLVERS